MRKSGLGRLHRIERIIDRAVNSNNSAVVLLGRAARKSFKKLKSGGNFNRFENELLQQIKILENGVIQPDWMLKRKTKYPKTLKLAVFVTLFKFALGPDIVAQEDPCAGPNPPPECRNESSGARTERERPRVVETKTERVHNDELNVDVYSRTTKFDDGSVKVEMFRDEAMTEKVGSVDVRDSGNAKDVHMEVGGQENDFSVTVDGDKAHISGTIETNDGEPMSMEGTLSEDASGETYSGDVTVTVERDGQQHTETGRIVVDKETGQILDSSELTDDDSIDS